MKTATEQNFHADVLARSWSVPVLAVFTATWCGPCKQLKPLLEEMSQGAGFEVVAVDVDQSPNVSRHYGVSSMPTMVLFRSANEAARKIGNPGSAEGIRRALGL